MIKKYKHFVYLSLIILTTSSFAQNINELKKLKDEYEKMQQTQDIYRSNVGDDIERLSDRQLPKNAMIYLNNQFPQDKKNVNYGYDFFTRRDSIEFWENLSIPSNYIIGPGDELVISLWGETQLRKSYIITRDGKIYDDKVGLLNVGGRTLENVRNYLFKQFGRTYSTINAKTPSTYIDISLGELKSINVNFVGELHFPGVYTIHPFSNVITGLIQAGGVDTVGSLRKILIKREKSIVSIVDLYDFFINGELSSNIQLRDQDIVIVPPRQSVVQIDSAIIRPGIYESIKDETVYDLIQFAGGPSHLASDKIGVRRTQPIDKLNSSLNADAFYVDYENTKLIKVNSGDQITLLPLFKDVFNVEVIGQVKSPGLYLFYEGMTLLDLLDLGGGLQDTTFLKSVYLSKAEIIRRNPNVRYDQVIPVNLNELLNDPQSNDLLLQNLDRVVIHSNLNFFEQNNIQILGEVNVPGSYPLIKDNESLQSFIDRAGGLTSKALDNGISIYRNKKYFDSNLLKQDLNNEDLSGSLAELEMNELENEKYLNHSEEKIRVAWQNANISLMPGDSVVVKEVTKTVFVTGSVYNQGLVEFRKGRSLKYYLNAAGGLTESANKGGIIVLYSNGIVSPNKWYRSPSILDGSIIIVNEKAPEEPFDITEFATNWTSIVASMITAIALASRVGA